MSDNVDLAPVPETDEKFYKRGSDFERDRELMMEKHSAVGWRLFYGATVMCVLLLVCVVVLVMRHRPLGFLTTVDKATGLTTTILPIDETNWNATEIEAKHDIERYVRSRETYLYPMLQRDYNMVMNMSCNDPEHPVAQSYDSKFGGEKGLDVTLGAGTEYRVEILSTRLPVDEPGKAVVTFEKTTYRGLKPDPAVKSTRYEVSMSYKYEPTLLATEAVWVENPRGFKVCAYRVDPLRSAE